MFKASIVGLITILSTPAIAGRINADVNCLQGAEDMQFDCMFMLMQDAAPLQGAEFTVLPQMPSMPMAHNTQPTQALRTQARSFLSLTVGVTQLMTTVLLT